MIPREPIGPREAMWRDALKNGSARDRADAALRLGKLLWGVGDSDAAELLLREAAESCDPCVTPRACWALAEALAADGRNDEAVEYLSRAAGAADPQSSPDVVLAIATRCAALGQTDAAVAVYHRLLQEVAQSESKLAAVAAQRLADIHRERGESGKALDLYGRAFRDGSIDLKPHAAMALADLLLEREQSEIAETICRWIVASEHADLAPRAAYQLALLRREAGDHVDAVETLRTVALSSHPIYASMAEELLLPLIGNLDVSGAVDDLVEEVLGDSQLQFPMLGRSRRHSVHLELPCEARPVGWHPKDRCYQPTRYVLVIGILPTSPSWAARAKGGPALLGAGDRLKS